MKVSYQAGASAVLVLVALIAQTDLVEAHAQSGNRFFPATLGVDDPGVNDELALPTFTYLPVNGDGVVEYDLSFEYDKRITPNFALGVDGAYTRLKPGGSGFQNFGLSAKYQAVNIHEHEFLFSVGVDSEIGGTGAARVGADRFSTLTPTAYFGKGLGDLPSTLDMLRPFALTGQVGYSIPTQSSTSTVSIDPTTGLSMVDVERNAQVLSYGFTLQYSLPYMNANVREVGGPEFLKHLVPLVEVAFATPVANTTAGQRFTTGTVQPGVVYTAPTYQIALEAVVPINGQSGKNVGFVGQLHVYLDDILPNSIGRPIFQ